MPKFLTPEIIKESKNFLVEGVKALDASKHGWWRFVIIVVISGIAISGIAISTKYDPNHHSIPQHDSACRLDGNTLICE